MTIIAVPYFLDEHLPDLDLVVPADLTVTAELPPGGGWPALLPLHEAVASRVADVITGGGRPLVLYGDCTAALGVMAGLQRAGLDPAVIWLDAHGDVQTMETTTSGFIGGMPLRVLVGYRPELVATALGLRAVPERRVVLVDARDLDPPEVEYLSQASIVRTTVPHLSPSLLPSGPLYVHLDLDIVDPRELTGLRYPAPGGPTLAAVAEAVGRVLATGRVVAVGIACTWHQGSNPGHLVRPHLEPILSWQEAPPRAATDSDE